MASVVAAVAVAIDVALVGCGETVVEMVADCSG